MQERVGDVVAELAAAAGRPGRARRGPRPARVDARRPLHVPRLPRVRHRSPRTARTCCVPSPARGSASCVRADERPISVSFAQLPPEARRLAREKNLLNLTKANSRATVHRPAYLDYVGVKRFDADGEVVGERRFLGLYTHTAYSASPWEIPRAPAQGAARGRAVGPAARQPRPQGARRHPRDVSARRAVPDLGGRALRDRARASSISASAGACGCSSAATRSAASSPVSSTCRASASTPEPAADPGHPPGRRSAARASTTRRVSPSRCWPASTSSSTPSRARFRSTTSPRSRPVSRRRRAPGRTTSATRSRSRSASSAPARSSSATARRSPAPTARTSPPGRRCPTSSGSSGSTPTATSG